MIKVLIVALSLFVGAQGVVKCFAGAEGDAADCADDAVTKCSSPVFTEFTGASAQEYGCGPCPDDSAATCAECVSAADDACNARIEAAEDFSCAAYSYDAETSAFVAADDKTVCKSLKDTVAKCNAPTATSAAEYVQLNAGCGPCNADALAGATCAECAAAECSSATTFTTLLAIAAIIYNMI